MTTKSNVFKIRCETTDDAFRFLEEFFKHTDETNHIQIDRDGYSGCDLTITTIHKISTVKMIIKSMYDLHTMYETIEPIEKYTGIRNNKS